MTEGTVTTSIYCRKGTGRRSKHHSQQSSHCIKTAKTDQAQGGGSLASPGMRALKRWKKMTACRNHGCNMQYNNLNASHLTQQKSNEPTSSTLASCMTARDVQNTDE
ncbi:MAG: hypothetical protein OIF55_06060 [Amphritea sp.]|nr:hypothetical protein [Amphritea sp.]